MNENYNYKSFRVELFLYFLIDVEMIELEAEWSLELIIKIDERNFKIFCLQLARERWRIQSWVKKI